MSTLSLRGKGSAPFTIALLRWKVVKNLQKIAFPVRCESPAGETMGQVEYASGILLTAGNFGAALEFCCHPLRDISNFRRYSFDKDVTGLPFP